MRLRAVRAITLTLFLTSTISAATKSVTSQYIMPLFKKLQDYWISYSRPIPSNLHINIPQDQKTVANDSTTIVDPSEVESFPVSGPQSQPQPPTSARLPSSLRPIHYTVTVSPQLAPPWPFEGTVSVSLEVVASTKELTLNMLDILTSNDTAQVLLGWYGSLRGSFWHG